MQGSSREAPLFVQSGAFRSNRCSGVGSCFHAKGALKRGLDRSVFPLRVEGTVQWPAIAARERATPSDATEGRQTEGVLNLLGAVALTFMMLTYALSRPSARRRQDHSGPCTASKTHVQRNRRWTHDAQNSATPSQCVISNSMSLRCPQSILSSRKFDVHRLDVSEKFNRGLALFSGVRARCLHAAERHLRLRASRFAIDVNHPGSQSP